MRRSNQVTQGSDQILVNFTNKVFVPILQIMEFNYHRIEVNRINKGENAYRYDIQCYDMYDYSEGFIRGEINFLECAVEIIMKGLINDGAMKKYTALYNHRLHSDIFTNESKSAFSIRIQDDHLLDFSNTRRIEELLLDVKRIYVFLSSYNFLQQNYGNLIPAFAKVSLNPVGIGIFQRESQGQTAFFPIEWLRELPVSEDLSSHDLMLKTLNSLEFEAQDMRILLEEHFQEKAYKVDLVNLRKAVYFRDMNQARSLLALRYEVYDRKELIHFAVKFSSLEILQLLLESLSVGRDELQNEGFLRDALNEFMIPWHLAGSAINSNESKQQYLDQWDKIEFLIHSGAEGVDNNFLDRIIENELDTSNGLKVMLPEDIIDFFDKMLRIKNYFGLEIGVIAQYISVSLTRESGSEYSDSSDLDTDVVFNSETEIERDEQEDSILESYYSNRSCSGWGF